MSGNREPRIGDRVRIDGGRWDGNTGVVADIRTPDDKLFDGSQHMAASDFINEPYAYVKFNAPLEMVGGKLDSVGVPVRRLRTF